MMHINGLFGDWRTWGLLFLAWFSLGALASIAFSFIARVGKRRERKNDDGNV